MPVGVRRRSRCCQFAAGLMKAQCDTQSLGRGVVTTRKHGLLPQAATAQNGMYSSWVSQMRWSRAASFRATATMARLRDCLPTGSGLGIRRSAHPPQPHQDQHRQAEGNHPRSSTRSKQGFGEFHSAQRQRRRLPQRQTILLRKVPQERVA